MLYEYACIECNHHFDVRHGANEKPELACPICQGKVKKVFHASGIIFKGSGWYVTDSAPKRPVESTSLPPVEPAKTESTPTKTDDTVTKTEATPAKTEAVPAKA